MKKLLLLAMLVSTSLSLSAQYQIDSTFNTNGINEFTMWPGNIVNGEKIAYTPNNEVIVAGRWIDRLTVWKYKQNGDPDMSFGTNGYRDVMMPSTTWVRGLEIQPDGKILVLAEAEWAYYQNYAYSQAAIALARFLPDGTPDTTFNGTGLLIIDLVPAFEYHPYSLSLDNNNNIFVGGWCVEWGSYDCPFGTGQWFVSKFLTNGSLDTSFNSTGFIQSTSGDLAQTYATFTPMAVVLDVKPLPNGKVLAAGSFNGIDSSYFSFRLNANGLYDNTYGLNGRIVTHITAFHIMPPAVTFARILNDESIIYNTQYILDGTVNTPDTTTLYVYKKDAAGNTQTSFGTNGYLTFTTLANRTRLAIDNQNRFVYCWYEQQGPNLQTVNFKRFLPNGATDNLFGTNGTLVTQPLPNDPYWGKSVMCDIRFNSANDDISMVSYRSASYAPTTFRVLNYSIPPEEEPNAIENISSNDFVLIYPNPSDGEIKIECTHPATYHIYNSTGKLVSTGQLQAGVNQITFGSNGMHVMEIIGADNRISIKKIMIR